MTWPGADKQMTMLCNRDNGDDSYPQRALTWPDVLVFLCIHLGNSARKTQVCELIVFDFIQSAL